MDASGPPPPPSFQESRAKAEDRRPSPTQDQAAQPPAKAPKHDASSYPGKSEPSSSSMGQYNTIDFLGNVSGGPHAAAAEALATFSSSVGSDAANNNSLFMQVPSGPPPASAAPLHSTSSSSLPPPTTSTLPSSGTQHGPPFLCPTCNTSYSRLEYLRRHERRHADIRPFACPCGKSFSRSDVLARHKTKCRVVLSDESGAAANSSDGRKSDRLQRVSSSMRSTRGRPAGTTRAGRPQDRETSAHDPSVDPALAGTAAVDPSMQPPPPLEGASDSPYASYTNAPPPTYAPHGHPESSDYAHDKTPYAHPGPSGSGAPPAASVAGAYGGMRMGVPHDPKMYAHGNMPRPGNAPAPYLSGAPAIHPELSSRGAPGMYSGAPATSTTGSPGTASAAPGSMYYSPSQHSEHAGSYATQPATVTHYDGSAAAAAAAVATPNGTQQGGSGMYAPNKELARFSVPSSGPLSPFSNTALNSNISPYLSAFSCARDMPPRGGSSPRMSNSTASGTAPTQPPAPPSTDEAPPPSDS